MPLDRHTGAFPTPMSILDFLNGCEQLQREQADALRRNMIERDHQACGNASAKQELLKLNARIASLSEQQLQDDEAVANVEAAVARTTQRLLALNTEKEAAKQRVNMFQSELKQMLLTLTTFDARVGVE
uniref:Uncharacterized protein n=1 Tax=Prymnesium polylepis TaxID=72548 RepID=A0A6V4SFK5_9EUKA|mmetsp:Transcript_34283/g.86051  ORF Transcript_34283/g.86051 Transcript_34283/m.86051 type:complete len:129 (+) Transcript_34283:274-660(+)|eukprot:1366182-Prymnesium_polylepis.1